ncbi:MAG: class I SAM-dependent methyltransferase [bacterium]
MSRNQDQSKTAWYQAWFGQDYLKVYPHRDEDEARKQVAFVEHVLPLHPLHNILDLGCGSGRHALELSRRGYAVTCLDLSPVLLNLAKQKNPETCCLRFVIGDMRHLPFEEAFDSVVSFFTTFGYFETDDENLETLKNIERVLKPGGTFLQDYLNKSFVIKNLVPFDRRTENGHEIIQERTYNRTGERIEKKITLKERGSVREYFESVRLYTLEEMQRLFAMTHLTLEETFGDFDGRPFSEDSPRLILVGRKEAK